MNKYGRLGAPVDVSNMLIAKLRGRTYRQIGDAYGCSAAVAYRRIKQHAKRLGVVVP